VEPTAPQMAMHQVKKIQAQNLEDNYQERMTQVQSFQERMTQVMIYSFQVRSQGHTIQVMLFLMQVRSQGHTIQVMI
jgi:hypothetical protein